MTIHILTLEIIGINPYVTLPGEVLEDLFGQAGKRKGPIPVRGRINGASYRQTLVRYAGAWRLYVNTTMLKDSPKRIGEQIELTVEYDPEVRNVAPPAAFTQALADNPVANLHFRQLPPSRQKEITRYLVHLKSEVSLQRNLHKIIAALEAGGDFFGRSLTGNSL
ncbi:MAG: YdeI/OmpD-associated family protein [Saprospiraceae bacterium]|nr:YdeI/OmpD-associated family protein [Saprospiraceae bacterium]